MKSVGGKRGGRFGGEGGFIESNEMELVALSMVLMNITIVVLYS